MRHNPHRSPDRQAPDYATPSVPADWASSRRTDMAVATAIHAIASDARSPEAIWDAPTPAEWDHVAGALYVKAGNAYLGKITSDRYLPTREAEQIGIVARVIEAMRDPLTLAISYGRRTGRCSCCGRELTDPSSVERGIGPICASKFAW